MRYIRYIVLAALAVVLIVIALANREPVVLELLPTELGTYLGVTWSVRLPLFLVILMGVAAGVLVGFIWEWLREHKHRAEAARRRREAERLEAEVKRMKAPRGRSDDVLALLE
ncbi:lipopolysaccharide assembly protein LapA domain-containing protein [Oceaniglobus roseus]|uniref:lipopolysaccharide assembly protein LapA domain-containing protein n=1 Tax=Oceaniglobus roseus TaxID=1737570 RepID=UPI000C7ED25B|nr:lipopolysaccharide assembly protein LapA domain-containing protein [Kandeliimicrobium roseum]